MIVVGRVCAQCQTLLVQGKSEKTWHFNNRRFCSTACSSRATSERRHAEAQAILEDYYFMVEMGEHPSWIPGRLGKSRQALAVFLRRWATQEEARIYQRVDW